MVKVLNFLSSFYHYEEAIEQTYSQRGHDDKIYEEKYTDDHAIFDMMAHSVLVYKLSQMVY